MGCCNSKNKVQDIEQIQPIPHHFEKKTEVVNEVINDLIVEEFVDEDEIDDKNELSIIDEDKYIGELEEWQKTLSQLTNNTNIMKFALNLKRSY